MDPRRLQRGVRNLCLALVAVGFVYLWSRYDTQVIPPEGCSPLLRFGPGNRLLVDARPPGFAPGDALLFRGPDQRLYLAAVARVRPDGAAPPGVESLWLEGDNPECPARASAEFGWIAAEDVAARVVMVWPW